MMPQELSDLRMLSLTSKTDLTLNQAAAVVKNELDLRGEKIIIFSDSYSYLYTKNIFKKKFPSSNGGPFKLLKGLKNEELPIFSKVA